MQYTINSAPEGARERERERERWGWLRERDTHRETEIRTGKGSELAINDLKEHNTHTDRQTFLVTECTEVHCS